MTFIGSIPGMIAKGRGEHLQDQGAASEGIAWGIMNIRQSKSRSRGRVVESRMPQSWQGWGLRKGITEQESNLHNSKSENNDVRRRGKLQEYVRHVSDTAGGLE